MERIPKSLDVIPEETSLRRRTWCPLKDIPAYFDINYTELRLLQEEYPSLFVVEQYHRNKKIFAKLTMKVVLKFLGYEQTKCWS